MIVIEGTDCSGKETQTKLLMEKLLNKDKINCQMFSFPRYDSPTGKIIGGPYLGKSYICKGWFPETSVNVDPKVSSLYYAADRKYHINKINEFLNNGINVILDRYTYSNMAHQGGKIKKRETRFEMYNWIEELEFNLLELPKCDIKIFLHMPTLVAGNLRKDRQEVLDENERDVNHLKNSELAYIEIAEKYNFKTIECYQNHKIRSIDDISEELYDYVKIELMKKKCYNVNALR